MKLFFALSILASFAVAQKAVIIAPEPQAVLAPGDDFVVDVDRPVSTTNADEVAIAIGLLSCSQLSPLRTCEVVDTSSGIGTVLYAGPYTPQLRPGGTDFYQNFTVTVPADFPSGEAALSVAHFSLVGTLAWPMFEVVNQTIIIS
ncbi:hypothetical protein BN946_scf184943.g15 [Trametes cinnabarina]|uniref:Uncharacterized protein n=1 Tax=Pycnoporus cinnabarinus TaxID=5643 RepID=A0A060SCN7_PYCCI|nr:hypothetical protein BN946_scf184943.g15 [Trametes cinnabarina]